MERLEDDSGEETAHDFALDDHFLQQLFEVSSKCCVCLSTLAPNGTGDPTVSQYQNQELSIMMGASAMMHGGAAMVSRPAAGTPPAIGRFHFSTPD